MGIRRGGASAAQRFAAFLAKYDPAVVAVARSAPAKMRRRVPGAVELVYDNYNALVIGFGPTERASEAILSIALYPRWATLFFLEGARLSDPDGVLMGAGRRVCHIVLTEASALDRPAVRRLIGQASPRPRRRRTAGAGAAWSSSRCRRSSGRAGAGGSTESRAAAPSRTRTRGRPSRR